MSPVRTPASLPTPTSPGVIVAVSRSVAAAYTSLSPRAPASEVVPLVRAPALSSTPPAPEVGQQRIPQKTVEAFPPVSPPMMRVASVPSQIDPPVELPPPPPPALRPAIAAAVLVPGNRLFNEADISLYHVCNALTREGLLRETARQHHIKLTGPLLTCSGCVQANGRRASVPTATSSRTTQPLQRVFVDLAGPRKAFLLGELCT